MTSDREVFMAANLLIKQYEAEASLFAAQRADEMGDRGDLDGKRLWMRVLTAVEKIQAQRPPAGETVH